MHEDKEGLAYNKKNILVAIRDHLAKTSKSAEQDNHRVQNNKHISASNQCKVCNPTTLTAAT
jgi:hypothetical protein